MTLSLGLFKKVQCLYLTSPDSGSLGWTHEDIKKDYFIYFGASTLLCLCSLKVAGLSPQALSILSHSELKILLECVVVRLGTCRFRHLATAELSGLAHSPVSWAFQPRLQAPHIQGIQLVSGFIRLLFVTLSDMIRDFFCQMWFTFYILPKKKSILNTYYKGAAKCNKGYSPWKSVPVFKGSNGTQPAFCQVTWAYSVDAT